MLGRDLPTTDRMNSVQMHKMYIFGGGWRKVRGRGRRKSVQWEGEKEGGILYSGQWEEEEEGGILYKGKMVSKRNSVQFGRRGMNSVQGYLEEEGGR